MISQIVFSLLVLGNIVNLTWGVSTCPPLAAPQDVEIECRDKDSNVVDCNNTAIFRGIIGAYKCKNSPEWANSTLKCICRGKWKGLSKFSDFASSTCGSSFTVTFNQENGTYSIAPLPNDSSLLSENGTVGSARDEKNNGFSSTEPQDNSTTTTSSSNNDDNSSTTSETSSDYSSAALSETYSTTPNPLVQEDNSTTENGILTTSASLADSSGIPLDGSSTSSSNETSNSKDGLSTTPVTVPSSTLLDGSSLDGRTGETSTQVMESSTSASTILSGTSSTQMGDASTTLPDGISSMSSTSSDGISSTASDASVSTTSSMLDKTTTAANSQETTSTPSAETSSTASSDGSGTSTTQSSSEASTTITSTSGDAKTTPNTESVNSNLPGSESGNASSTENSLTTTPASSSFTRSGDESLTSLTDGLSTTPQTVTGTDSDSSSTKSSMSDSTSTGLMSTSSSQELSSSTDTSSNTTTNFVTTTTQIPETTDSMPLNLNSASPESRSLFLGNDSSPVTLSISEYLSTTSNPTDYTEPQDITSPDMIDSTTKFIPNSDRKTDSPLDSMLSATTDVSGTTTVTTSGSPDDLSTSTTPPSTADLNTTKSGLTMDTSMPQQSSSSATNELTTTFSPPQVAEESPEQTPNVTMELIGPDDGREAKSLNMNDGLNSTTMPPEDSMSTTTADTNSYTSQPQTVGDNNASEFQTYGLLLHNDLRRQHHSQPLKLNETLNKKAQSWAENLLDKEKLTASPGKRDYAENVFRSTGGAPSNARKSLESALKAWYASVSWFNFSNPRPSGFSQIVWNATTDLGIGVASNSDANDPKTIVVATYYPRGNVILVNNNQTDPGFYFNRNVFPKEGSLNESEDIDTSSTPPPVMS